MKTMMDNRFFLPERVKKRKTFLLATHNGWKFVARGFIVQIVKNNLPQKKRVGFTTTKKLGGAVVRNRIRRRLREVCRLTFNQVPVGFDYIFIGRTATIDRPFDLLCADGRYIIKQFSDRLSQEQNSVIVQHKGCHETADIDN